MITVETLGSSSAGNCYRLLSGGRSLLLECGISWKDIRRKLNFETADLDGCLISHFHGDHARSINDVMKAGIDVYCPCFNENGHHRMIDVNPGDLFTVGPNGHWGVKVFDTVHDSEGGSLGYVVNDREDVLVFITDTAYCRYTIPGFSILMVEANYSESILSANVEAGHIDKTRAKRVRENHMSIERVIEFLKANDLSRCRDIHLLHLSSGNSSAEWFKRLVQEATGIATYIEG